MTQTRGNYERIRTFQASYVVHNETYSSAKSVTAAYGSRLPKDSTPALIDHSEWTFKVAIDMESGKVFRQKDTTRFLQLTTNSREPVDIPFVRPADLRSIVTSEDYKYFAPKDPPATNKVVVNQPGGHNKRYARRVDVEKARNRDHGDLIDPRDFYRCSSHQMSWEEIQFNLSLLKGDKGAELQQKLANLLKVDQAEYEGGTWYRLRMMTNSGATYTSVWSPLAGFNPVSQTVSRGDKAREMITNSKSWKWKKIDGIFVPEEVHEVWHPKNIPENVDTLNRTITLKECMLNAPLAPNQFDYSALGLKPGDLVLDDIEQTAFIIDSDGQPTRLAAYNEEYVPKRH